VRSSGGAFRTTNARVEKPKGIEPRGEPAIVTMTDTAARKVPDMRLEEGKPEWGLRIRVIGGGCSGMSYELGWEDQAAPDDNVFEAQEGIKVYIDKNSAPYLAGIEIDFVDNNMMGAGFAITNPNVKSSCGGGQSHQF
jgi:iron-sulfur cluster assembly accessory protein